VGPVPAVPAPAAVVSTPSAPVRECATCHGHKQIPVKYPHTAADGHEWIELRTEKCGPCGGSGKQQR
jgi:hypothetical protein